MVLQATHLLKPIVDKMLLLLVAFGLFYTIELPTILQGISRVTSPLFEYFPDVVDVSRTDVATDNYFMDPSDDYGDSGSFSKTSVLDMH